MLRASAALVLIIASSAGAQSISHQTNNPSRLIGDPTKVVCEKEDKIGTRLGGEKVCHTVAEWNQIHDGVRENAERLQAGAWGPCAPASECGGNTASFGDLAGGGGPH